MKKKIITLMMILLFTLTLTSCFKPGNKPDKNNRDGLLSANVLSNVKINIADAVSLGLVEEKKDKPEPVSMVQRLSLLVNDSNNNEVNKIVLAKKTENDEVVTVDFGLDEEFEVIKLKVQRKFTYMMIAPRTESGYIEVTPEDPEQMSVKRGTNLATMNYSRGRGYATNRNNIDYSHEEDFDDHGYYNNEVYQSYVIDNDTGDIYNPEIGTIQNIEDNYVITANNEVVEMTITDNGLTTKSNKIHDERDPRYRTIFSDKYGNVFIENNAGFGDEEYISIQKESGVSYGITDDGIVIKFIVHKYEAYTSDIEVRVYGPNKSDRPLLPDDVLNAKIVYSDSHGIYKDPYNYVYVDNGIIIDTKHVGSELRIYKLDDSEKTDNIQSWPYNKSPFGFSSGFSRITHLEDNGGIISKVRYVNAIDIAYRIKNDYESFTQNFKSITIYDDHIGYRNPETPLGITLEFDISMHTLRWNQDRGVLYNRDGEYVFTQDNQGNLELKLVKSFIPVDEIIKDWTPINRG